MIGTHQLKPFIYRNKGSLSAQQVEEVLSAIHAGGQKIKNQTAAAPEIATWKTTLSTLIPTLGEDFVISALQDVEHVKLSLKYISEIPFSFWNSHFVELSPYAINVGISIDLISKTIPIKSIGAHLHFSDGKTFLGISYYDNDLDRMDPKESIPIIEQLVRLAELPLRLEVNYVEKQFPFEKTPRRYRHFTLHHTMPGGSLKFKDSDGHPLHQYSATIPGASLTEMVERFYRFIRQSEFQIKDACWVAVFRVNVPQPDPGGLASKISQLGLPDKKVESTFGWHLKSYKCFKAMPQMVKYLNGGVTQYLLDFEFGAGRQCQVVAICGKDRKYKLIFALDHEEGMPELAKLVKLKLQKE